MLVFLTSSLAFANMVDIQRQPDWKDPKSAQEIYKVNGDKFDPKGKTIEAEFQVVDNLNV